MKEYHGPFPPPLLLLLPRGRPTLFLFGAARLLEVPFNNSWRLVIGCMRHKYPSVALEKMPAICSCWERVYPRCCSFFFVFFFFPPSEPHLLHGEPSQPSTLSGWCHACLRGLETHY